MRKGYKEGRRRSQNGRKRGVFWIRRWGVKIEGGGGNVQGEEAHLSQHVFKCRRELRLWRRGGVEIR